MRAVVCTGGGPPDPRVKPFVSGADLVIAADSGIRVAHDLGLTVDLLIGDLDSIAPSELQAALAAAIAVERHRTDKDATDLELAIDAARARGASEVTVVGGWRGGDQRLDHLAGQLLLLTSPALAPTLINAWLGTAWLAGVHGPGTVGFCGAIGEIVTLLPTGGTALGITTTGLRYELVGDELAVGTTRGISNVLAQCDATVSLASGSLLIIRPHALEGSP